MAEPVRAAYPHIVHESGVRGGEPIVEGTRIPVATLVRAHQFGMDFDEILVQFPTLTPGGLHGALLYYFDHAEEIDAILAASARAPAGAVDVQGSRVSGRVSARLYLDEDVYRGVATGLLRRGFDVLTTAEAGNSGRSDEEQLRFAIAEKRCVFTFNRGDFVQLHAALLSAGEHHSGIVLAPQAPIGAVVRALAQLLSTRSAEDLRDQLVWLAMPDIDRA